MKKKKIGKNLEKWKETETVSIYLIIYDLFLWNKIFNQTQTTNELVVDIYVIIKQMNLRKKKKKKKIQGIMKVSLFVCLFVFFCCFLTLIWRS